MYMILPRLFYGWLVLIGLSLTYAASSGILLNTLPLLYPTLITEFGWDAAEVTRPASISFFATAVLSLLVGYIIDKSTPRVLMVTGSVIFAATIYAYSHINSLGQMALIYCGLSIGFSLNGVLPSMVVVSRWFIQFRGIAVGILLMSSSVGGALLPLLVGPILAESGWREVLFVVSFICVVLMIVPCLFILKNRPEEINSTPDGISLGISHNNERPKTMGVAGGIGVLQLMRMPIFYFVAFATGVMWLCISAVIQHQSIYLGSDLGIGGLMLSKVFFVFFVSSVIGKFAFGWLSDYFAKADIMLLATFNLIVGLIIFRFIDANNVISIYSYAFVYGVGFAGSFTMIQLVIAELFAGPTYGRILGTFVFIDTIAGGAGVLLLGEMRVATNSYLPAITFMIILSFIALLTVFYIRHFLRLSHD